MTWYFFLIRKIIVCLILQNHFFKTMSIDTLSLIITEYHTLSFNILICRNIRNFLILMSINNLFLTFILFNWIATDLKFIMWKASFILCCILIFWNYWIKIKNIFIWSFQFTKYVVCNICIICTCCMLIWTILRLFSFTSWR